MKIELKYSTDSSFGPHLNIYTNKYIAFVVVDGNFYNGITITKDPIQFNGNIASSLAPNGNYIQLLSNHQYGLCLQYFPGSMNNFGFAQHGDANIITDSNMYFSNFGCYSIY